MFLFKVAAKFSADLLNEQIGVFHRDPEESLDRPIKVHPRTRIEDEPIKAYPRTRIEEFESKPELPKFELPKDEPLEFNSPEYNELLEQYIKQPAVVNYEKAVGKAIIDASTQMGLEIIPDIVGLSIDGKESGYWLFDKGLGKYRQANDAVGISIDKKELTKIIREFSSE